MDRSVRLQLGEQGCDRLAKRVDFHEKGVMSLWAVQGNKVDLGAGQLKALGNLALL